MRNERPSPPAKATAEIRPLLAETCADPYAMACSECPSVAPPVMRISSSHDDSRGLPRHSFHAKGFASHHGLQQRLDSILVPFERLHDSVDGLAVGCPDGTP